MANKVRPLLPTDLPALLTHARFGSENAAFPRERIGAGTGQASLRVLGDQLGAFRRQRSTWVSLKRQRLQGLVSARPRGGIEAWEVDYLIDGTDDHNIVANLLDRSVAAAGKKGAQKLFLRLTADSALLPPVLETGFQAYQEETLYLRHGTPDAPALELRPAVASDSYPLFRLYCEVKPEATRRLEAATFDEWHAAQEQRWARNAVRLVLETKGQIRGAVCAARLRQGLMLDLVLTPEAEDDLPGVVSAAAAAAGSAAESIWVLAPDTAPRMTHKLKDAGFTPQNEYISLVRRTAKPITIARKVPGVAKNTVGV